MHPDHQPQPPEKREEDRLRQLEANILALHGQLSTIAAQVRHALAQWKAAD